MIEILLRSPALIAAGLAVALLTGGLAFAAQRSGVSDYLLDRTAAIEGEIREIAAPGGARALIYLPPGYADGDARYPVIYHLHGAGVRWSWLDTDVAATAAQNEQAVAAGRAGPKIVVAPYDPDRFSMWSDSADGAIARSAELLALIEHVDASHRTVAARGGRILQGFSMGGFGAASNGLRRQDLFAAIVVFDGAMHDWRTLSTNRASIAATMFSDDPARFAEWSPWEAAQRADPARTPALVLAGAMGDWAARYAERLAELGYDAALIDTGCGHDLVCMQAHSGQDVAAFIEASLGGERAD